MLSDDTIDFIENLVSSKLYNETAFTSLDIANAAKDEGHWARNNEVGKWLRSNVIRIAYSQGCLFNQTLIRVDAKGVGPTLAYLYHHMNDDPDNYLDRDQNPKSCHRPGTVTQLGVSNINLINQSIARTTPATIVPQSFASRQAAREWVRNNPDYVVVDRGIYDLNRWGVKER